ncbi:MAG: DNA-3-methyladenine glycosylase 2 family protein [Sulfitobacter sp.]
MKNLGRIIKNPIDVRQGAEWLAKTEPRFAYLLEQTGPLPLRLKPQGFNALLEIIVSQQVSVASADAIRLRLSEAGLKYESAVRAAGEDGLRAAGLSRPKVRYALALADAEIDYSGLRQMTNEAAIARLCEVPGIGPWSAQIYVMFCMGRADAFAPGDLALQEAAKVLFDLLTRPTAQELSDMAQGWSPWRSVAARALFAYYRIVKQREGLG